ncbi:MAG: Glyoxalase/bleomycin resistance protein/dioxygenase [Phenylobacterium sp.]|nr:Glyoxalase/bleomycin resistance protein/dioxygenase [Phenylobacterium sp.]
MSDFHGRFIWYELLTSDPAAAKRFYGDVVGWSFQDMPMEGMTYTILETAGAGQGGVGGLMAIPDEAKARGVPPNWSGYVAVDDTDAMAGKIKAAGGKIVRPPEDIPGVGRFAVVTDPHGAVFEIMTPQPTDQPREPPPPKTLGTAGWRELYAGDPEADLGFYAAMFGWTKEGVHDMGPMGTYLLFGTPDGVTGGMMKKPDQVPTPCWVYYFRVGDIEAAAGRVKAGGGQLIMGPVEVPSGDWVLQGSDPQGAVFALIGTHA